MLVSFTFGYLLMRLPMRNQSRDCQLDRMPLCQFPVLVLAIAFYLVVCQPLPFYRSDFVRHVGIIFLGVPFLLFERVLEASVKLAMSTARPCV